MSSPRPPKLFTHFFKWYCKPHLQEQILGDMEEQFEEDVENHGVYKAKRRFIWTVLRFFRKDIIKPVGGGQKLNNYGMFKNYFITSIRFIKREKVYSLMNITGLALGIACGLIIYKILDHEISYDKHHSNYERIYRVNNEDVTSNGVELWRGQAHPLAGALRNEFSQLKATMTFYEKEALIGIENDNGNITRYQEEDGVVFIEPQFLGIFSLKFIVGEAKSALDRPGKVILTQSLAKRYFGVQDQNLHRVIGEKIILENERVTTVSAIVEDTPKTSDFPFTIYFHYQDQDVSNPWFYEGKSWVEYNSATNCYILLDEGVSSKEIEHQLIAFVDKYLPEHTAEKRSYKLQALSDLHYSDTLRRTYAGITATKEELTVFGLVGLFLILTACINFINLATAQAVKRSKEIGVRKTMGSSKRQLVVQFLCETFVITLFASFLGIVIATLMAKPIQDIYPYPIDLNFLGDFSILGFMAPALLMVTLLSGFYPATILAKMNPVLAIKNTLNIKQTSGFLSLRRGLVILQFGISQILIIGILILNAQMNFFQEKDLGFNKESIVTIQLPENDSTALQTLKNNLMNHSGIKQVSLNTAGPIASFNSTNPIFHPNIEGQDYTGNMKNVDESYFEVYEMEFIAGEPFKDSDPSNLVVVNEKLVRTLGYSDPNQAIGEQFQYGRSGRLIVTISGVVKDFHSASLHAEINNVILAHYPWNIFQASIKLHKQKGNLEALKGTLEHIENSWASVFPNYVFDVEFYDDQLASMYELEESVSKLFRLFVAIAIFIGAMGLYGLVSFMANQKTKEIGIRKVLGASELNIWNIFSKELLVLLLVAFMIAAPTSYLLMSAFLDTYAYRITIGPEFFILAIIVSLVVALITVGYKSLKVAKANPIESLKDE